MATVAAPDDEPMLASPEHGPSHNIASGPEDEVEAEPQNEPLAEVPMALPPDAEDLKDGLVLAEDLKDALGLLRMRGKGLKRFYQRLADAERAAVKVLHKTIAKDGRKSQSLGAAVWNQDKAGDKGRMSQLPSRLKALWEQRASQMESLAGVWDSQQQRWASYSAQVHEARRKVEDDTRPLAKELCAARVDADRLQRKYMACRQVAVIALRARGSIEESKDFATACGVGKSEKDFQKALIRADSAFRDYVLTKHELSRQADVLQLAEEQHRIQVMKVHALTKEHHLAFFRELKESLQLAISSLNVFCGTMLDVHSELGDHGALSLNSPSGGDDDDDECSQIEVSFHSEGSPKTRLLNFGGPQRALSPGSGGTAGGVGGTGWRASKVFRLGSVGSSTRERQASGDASELPQDWGNEGSPSRSASPDLTAAGLPLERRASAKLDTDDMTSTVLSNLEADRSALKVLQGLLAGFRDAEDQALRNLTVAQLPTPGQVEPTWIEEASSSLRSFVQLRIEAAGAMSTLLVEQLLPAVDTFLAEYKEDSQLVQEEQRRMETSLSQKSQKQKLSEVPIHFANQDSELIFQKRLVRIADEVKQRMRQRFSASASMLDELLLAERSRLHIRISDAAPQALGRLAARSTTDKDTRLPLWWLHNASTTNTAQILFGPAAQGDEQAKTDEQLLDAESVRVKVLARAVSAFSGKENFSFRAGDQVKVTLQVGDTWRGIDPQGNKGDFPSHYVEVGDQSALQKLSLADLVTLFKKDVLQNDAYVPSAEDEEFAARFSEYLGEASGPALRVLASFSCALLSRRKVAIAALQKVLETRPNQMPANLLDTVPLQGRLYVTANWMGFFSHFSTTSLQDTTRVLFRISEMQGLEKRTNALILQNSIEVSLSDGSMHSFSSFQNRDSAYETLVNLRLVSRSVQSELEQLAGQSTEAAAAKGAEGGAEAKRAEARVVVLPAYSTAPYPQLPAGAVGPASPMKHELPGRIFGVPLETLFDVVFRDFGPNTLQAEFQVANGSKLAPGQSESPPWSPAPAAGAASCPVTESTEGPRRQVRWLRPVTAGAGWMRKMAKVPDWMDCDECMALFGLGEGKGFVVTLDAELAGMPYIDYFVLKVRYKAVAVGESRTQLDAEVELDWRKSTLLQSRIEQTSIEEVRNTFEANLLPLISKRLTMLDSGEASSVRGPESAASGGGSGSGSQGLSSLQSGNPDKRSSSEAAVAALQKRAANAVGNRTPAEQQSSNNQNGLAQLTSLLKVMWSVISACLGLFPRVSGNNARIATTQVWLLMAACLLLVAILRVLLRIESALTDFLERSAAASALSTQCAT